MRPLWKDFFTAVCMGLILPGILLNLAVYSRQRKPEETQPEETEAESPAFSLRMRLRGGDGTEEMDMDEYLIGVVLAEMPTEFEPEALKAQSVAARTYTHKAHVTGGKHGDGSVCTDPTCCQGYIRPEDYLLRGGTEEGLEKVKSAVMDTSCLVLTYQGELIEATYFSCSGGSTEDAVSVWGTDFPYLQAVSSPGEEGAAHYTDTVTFLPEAFRSALGIQGNSDPNSWLGAVTYTEGGGVATMAIGSKTYTGTQLRSLLGLRSTAFTIEVQPTQITVTTYGYGHRVGMSQYGAEAMAVAGSTYQEILMHYYQGTTLTPITEQ